ncbi:MAG TPA: ATP-binding protein, partial [Candidatus Sericytochromatia bacterium]
VVVNQGIAALGARSGTVTLLSDNDTNLKVVSAIGYPQSVRDAWATFPLTLQAPLAETVHTGEPIFLRNLAELLARYPHLADTQAQTENQAFAYIPLIVEGRKLGQFGISFAQEQAFGEEDKAFMLTLARQCAQAIARAQLYEAEQNARDEAEVANRVKDEFLAVLSHELRTPLNPILGWSKLLRSRNLDEKTTIRALETIERNAQLQSQLIEDLLDISRIIRGNLNLNFSPVNLASTIQAAIETVALSAQARSVEIKTVIQPNIGQILGNSERLQQVIWNLLSNAIKFTPLGGQVEIALETVDSLLPINDGNPQLAMNQEQSTSNNYAQIKVTDTGRGISPDFLPYVFDYFRQADATTTRTFGGLGLGLAIVRHLVELHGGSVQAESKGEGQGATFIVKLPLMPAQPAINEKIELPSDSPNLSEVKILVVDDEADSLDFCAFVLEQQGAIVTKVASATAALKALAESQPDVLVSDIGMPEMDGYMLMRQIRALPLEQGGGLSAIALTAYASEADQEQALAAGFNNHLSKPVEPSELAKSIANLIASN